MKVLRVLVDRRISKARLVLLALGLVFFTGGQVDVFGQERKAVPVVSDDAKHDVSPELRSISPLLLEPGEGEPRETPLFLLPKGEGVLEEGEAIDPVVQDWHGTSNMPAPIQNFEGISNNDNLAVVGFLLTPPDTEGDVGPNHYVQWNNLVFAVYDKSGTKLYGPAAGNTLWQGFGGPCEFNNDGDPIVLYDPIADRWLASQFALPEPYYQCIAVSQTGDPLGSWYRYAFKISDTKMNDYPKFGVWPDGYYMSVNQFGPGWAGAGVVAFERDKMLNGQPARMVYFDLFGVDPNLGGMLPSDLDGSTLPPTNSPNYFLQFDDDAWGYPQDQLEGWAFDVDWNTPSNSTFTKLGVLATVPFDSDLCTATRERCIDQPGTSTKLEAISDRLMHRMAYRNFGDHESLVLNHTVDANGSGKAGIRWYELRINGGAWSIYQQGTYSPDSDHRWMGSIAMDQDGNISLGYSVSSTSTFPSIRYAGRLATDPMGQLSQGEAVLIAGGGSQTGSNRWGDYSMMAVDPSDDSTFWYTQEYYQTTSSRGWQTRIGSFNFSITDPDADIKANGSDDPVDITTGDNLSVTVQLDSGDFTSDNADWWIAVDTPFGWYHYDLNSDSWVPGFVVTYQGPLADLPPFEVLNMSGLPPGTYTFYFGVDMNMNGSVDLGVLFFDTVVVNITAP